METLHPVRIVYSLWPWYDWGFVSFLLYNNITYTIFFYKSKDSVSVCPSYSAKPLVRLTSDLAGVLPMTRGCACVLLVQFGCMSHSILIKIWIFYCLFAFFSACRDNEQKHGQCHSAIETHTVAEFGIASVGVLFIVRRAACHWVVAYNPVMTEDRISPQLFKTFMVLLSY